MDVDVRKRDLTTSEPIELSESSTIRFEFRVSSPAESSATWTGPKEGSVRYLPLPDGSVDEGDHSKTQSAELEISRFAGLMLDYLKAPASTKHSLRRYVVDELRICRRLSERISTLLCAAVDSNRPERLDDAIDVLGNKQVDLVTYLLTKTHRALDELNEDAQYILIRAVGKRRDTSISHIIHWALESKLASLQEAAVEALVEFDTAETLAIVREIADGDGDEAVKQVAAEYLSELEEG